MAEEVKKETKKAKKGPTMIKWKKPSGVEIKTNDNPDNIAMAEKLGWKQVK